MPNLPGPKAPNPIDIHVGRRVRIRRTLNGLSQTALAETLGITFQQLQKYESGGNRISASRLWAIAQQLDVSVGWFFAGIDDDSGDDQFDDFTTKRETLELCRNLDNLPRAMRRHFAALALEVAHQYGRRSKREQTPRAASEPEDRQSVPI